MESCSAPAATGSTRRVWYDGALRPVREIAADAIELAGPTPAPSAPRRARGGRADPARRQRRAAHARGPRRGRDGARAGAARRRIRRAAGGPMTILAQLSDLHLHAGDDDRGAAHALRAAVAAVLDLRPLPDAVLVSGDLGERGAGGRVRAGPRAARAAADARARAGRQPRRPRGPERGVRDAGALHGGRRRAGARRLPHAPARADGRPARPRVARGRARGGPRRARS